MCPLLQYSFSLTTFSPSGKLVQIEYALNAVNAGATSLGIKASNGVVIATERKLPSILVDETTVSLPPHMPPSIHAPCSSFHIRCMVAGVPSAYLQAGTYQMQVQKTSLLTPNVGMVYSGMGPDYRVLVRKARKQAQAYYRLYHEHIPVAQLVRETAAVMQEFTRALSTGSPSIVPRICLCLECCTFLTA